MVVIGVIAEERALGLRVESAGNSQVRLQGVGRAVEFGGPVIAAGRVVPGLQAAVVVAGRIEGGFGSSWHSSLRFVLGLEGSGTREIFGIINNGLKY